MGIDNRITDTLVVKVFRATLQEPGANLKEIAEIVQEEETAVANAITFLINNFFTDNPEKRSFASESGKLQ